MRNKTSNSSYLQILKSTWVLGGVQVIDILIRIVRMKIVAILLGPSGVGIIGLYHSTIQLIYSASGFGLEFSSVKEIAQADAKGDKKQISKTIIVLRRWVWFTGIAGMLMTIIFSTPISKYAFGNESYSSSINLISLVLLLTAISGGQLALLQGLRKINLMAKAKVWGILVSFVLTVPLYWFFGFDAIVPVILISASIILAYSWFYSRHVHVEPIKIGLIETFNGGLEMCRLGFFMVISTLASVSSMYLVRVIIVNQSGIEAVGLFQCAWTVSSLYLAAVLQAMGTDYFPRLSGVSENNEKVVKLVNEQTEIVLLIAGPMVVGMLSFISLIVIILYSSEFTEAVVILHWMLAGTLLKVISWPLGFIMLAKGRGLIFIVSEFIGNATLLILVYMFWDQFGIEIAGIAYVAMYLIYLLTVYTIGNLLCGFTWSRSSMKLVVIFITLTVLALVNSKLSDGLILYLTGSVLLVTASLYSLYELNKIVGIRSLLGKVFSRY